MPTAVALIPARGGSRRVPGKNSRLLAGVPLIAHTIEGANAAEIFDDVVVSTDSQEIAQIARRHGATVPGLRPSEIAGATSPDIQWVEHTLDLLAQDGRTYDVFAILRPTSPFRTPQSIRAAYELLVSHGEEADSLRAVRVVREHPGKMWLVDGAQMEPLLPQPDGEVPLHSRQFQALPEIYVQDSSLELAWTRVVRQGDGIAGTRVLAWLSRGEEGLSIDYPEDFERAEALLAAGVAMVPVATSDAEA